jgi:hypothetical protein
VTDSPAPSAIPAQYQTPFVVYVVAVLLGIALIAAAYLAHTHGLWLLVGLIAWFSSHGLMVIFRVGIGPHTIREVFDPKTQSWAMLADVALAFAAGVGSFGWRYLDDGGWYRSWWWPVLAVVIMIPLVVARYVKFDRPNYIKDGAAVLLSDPWKAAHDLTTYLVLGGLVIMLCVPVLISGAAWSHWLTPALVIVGLTAYGAVLPHEMKLNPWNLHDMFDWDTMHYVSHRN